MKKKSEAKNPETTHLQKELRLEGTNIRKKRREIRDNLKRAKQNLKLYIGVPETLGQSPEWDRIETSLDDACIALAAEYTSNIESMHEQFASLRATITSSQ